ncbi:MAG: hydroxyisourate hydrolase, partial [Chloroflexi bacterium]|nr:hydroxyisourate hydrolase [Chloroflexota bacterium]
PAAQTAPRPAAAVPLAKVGLAAPLATPPADLLGQGPGCDRDLKPGCPLDCVPDGYDTVLRLKIYAADTGAPLAGVTVKAWQVDNDGGYHGLGTKVTNADGRVRLVVNCNWNTHLKATPPDLTQYQVREGTIGGKWAGMKNGCECYPCLGLAPVPVSGGPLPDDIYHWCSPQVELGWEPPYPVVVGQDPDQVGVTLVVTATVYDIRRTWYTCNVPLVDGGCPAGHVITHTEWIPDALDVSGLPPDTRANLALTPASQQAILTTLAERYPGLRIYQAYWPWEGLAFVFQDRNVAGGCPGQRFVATQNFPLADPGDYEVTVRVTTMFPPPSLRGRQMEDGRWLPNQALFAQLREVLHVLFVRQRLEF